jgi:MFS family permease
MPLHPARILSLIVLSVFLVRLDSSIVNISLPTMAMMFNASASEVSRITLAYLLLLYSAP